MSPRRNSDQTSAGRRRRRPFQRFKDREDRKNLLAAHILAALTAFVGCAYIVWAARIANWAHPVASAAFLFAELTCWTLFVVTTMSLQTLGPAFRVQRFDGFVESGVWADARLRAAAGIESFQDGNRRLFSYLHYQQPLRIGVRHWVVIRPNAYLEGFRASSPFYFSPFRHLTFGMMFHSIFTFPRWAFEAEANPQLLRTDGATGFGAHGMTRITVHVGPFDLEGSGFIFFDDLNRYRNWQLGARLRVPIGR